MSELAELRSEYQLLALERKVLDGDKALHEQIGILHELVKILEARVKLLETRSALRSVTGDGKGGA